MTIRHMRWAINFVPVLVILLSIGLFRFFEPVSLPVIRDFLIHEVRRSNEAISVKGTMSKVRDCELLNVGAYALFASGAERVRVPVKFLDAYGDDLHTRAPGTQGWGPWMLTIPMTPDAVAIQLYAVHRCHFAWAQTTHLATLPLIYKGVIQHD